MSKVNINKLGNGFDRLASSYDFLLNLTFGRSVNASQTVFLPENAPQTVLVIGGGTGKLLVELCRLYPDAQITWCDISAKMIEKTKTRITDADNITFIHGTIDDLSEQRFDLICTMYLLDCFKDDDLKAFIGRLKAYSHSDSTLIMADFAIPDGLFLGSICRIIVFFMYLFFYLTTGLSVWTLNDFHAHLMEGGLKAKNSRHFLSGFIYAGEYRF